jgi:hypothetical protein|tara:strand:- start:1576 stop:2022 length:447 start_codon:yes stop_codon:yes gene_type:complete
MTKAELREKIRLLIPTVVGNKKQADAAAVEYDELTKFPELKAVIVDLLTHEFDNFLSSIDWVAPKPTTFRINLKNDQDFYLIYSRRSWIAQVEGKKYYLLNLPEEERATEAIARVLRYGAPGSGEAADTDSGGGDVDVDVDDTTDIDI